MNLAQLHEALRLEILRRIEDKRLSGKSLALRTGMKQPHISNFLSRRRMLSMQAVDVVLAALNLEILDLLPGGTANKTPQRQSTTSFEVVPLVDKTTAIHTRTIARKDVVAMLPLPRGTLERLPKHSARSRLEWERFVAIRVTAREAFEMLPVLRPHACLLIDRHFISVAQRKGELPSLYAVKTPGGLAIRYVTQSSNRLILHSLSHTDPVALLERMPGQPANALIVGRVCLVLAQF